MKTRPDMVEILMPGGGSKIYRDSPILVRDGYVVIHNGDRTFEYPLDRVHRTVITKGDEE